MSHVSLGQRIKELRMKFGLTQVDLAKGICTPSMVSQIESDRARPSYKILYALAEKLCVSLDALLTDVDMNLEYISTYKMAKTMIASKEYSTAIPLLKDVIAAKRAVISEEELLIELSECYLHTQHFEDAALCLRKVQEKAILRQDSQMIIRGYHNIGLIEFHSKRYQLAIYNWQKALDEMEKLEPQDDYQKAHILTDLGQAHEQLGMMKDAIHFYSQASSLFNTATSMEEIAKVYMGLGQSYKRIKDYEKAADYSQKAINIFEALENVAMRAKVQVLSAISFAQEGRDTEAIQMLEESIQLFQELRKNEDVGIAYVELATIQFSIGELDTAVVSCQIARGLLPEMHPYQALGNHILGCIAHQSGNSQEALRRYQMAADCFKSLGEIGDWASVMQDMSRLKVEENDFQEAHRIISDVQSQTQQVLQSRGIVL